MTNLPRTPGPDLPAGYVWPPIEGRGMLGDAAPAFGSVRLSAAGEWRGDGDDWMAHSGDAARYEDERSGRTALLEWARWHEARRRYLSPRRCIALCADGDGGWRLWQVVAREVSLAERLGDGLRAAPQDRAAILLGDAALALERVHAALAPSGLVVEFETVAVVDEAPVYATWAPSPRGIALRPANFEPRAFDLERALERLLAARPRLAAALQHEMRDRVAALARRRGAQPAVDAPRLRRA